MSVYDERITAWRAMLATCIAQNAALVAVMATVSLNTISAQNITDINAAIAAIAAAVAAANPALTRPDLSNESPI